MTEAQKFTYLGDGVYASFDGYHIWLHVDRHPYGEKFRQNIAVEPSVLRSLNDYAKKVWERKKPNADE